jgi:hypothetical protein
LKLIVTGSRDDIAPPNLIEKSYPRWNPEANFEVIVGADHFYGGYKAKLEEILTSNLKKLGRPPAVEKRPQPTTAQVFRQKTRFGKMDT